MQAETLHGFQLENDFMFIVYVGRKYGNYYGQYIITTKKREKAMLAMYHGMELNKRLHWRRLKIRSSSIVPMGDRHEGWAAFEYDGLVQEVCNIASKSK